MLSGPRIILVVEDEPLIRMDAVDQLQSAGFETLEAGCVQDAMEVIQNRGPIQILFTDVDMPGGLSGIELAHEVRREMPEACIIVTSGQSLECPAKLPPGAHFHSKPYQIGPILVEIEEHCPTNFGQAAAN